MQETGSVFKGQSREIFRLLFVLTDIGRKRETAAGLKICVFIELEICDSAKARQCQLAFFCKSYILHLESICTIFLK
jgi:hypothetical protein